MYPASVAAFVMPPARMVFADQVPNQRRVLRGTLLQAGSSDPVSRPLRQTAPCPPSLRRPRDRDGLCHRGRRLVDAAPGHQGPDDPRHLFASATRTSIGGLRVSIPPNHVPALALAWTCRLMMTLLAPIISSRRKDRSLIFVVAPRRCLPPVECCRGTMPS